MADIKTNLRELSVAVTVGLLLKKVSFSLKNLYDVEYFFEAVKRTVSNNTSFAKAIVMGWFNSELRQIIKNGYDLGKKIYQSKEFDIDKDSVILWTGNDTGKDDPVDIIIGKYKFSLKEESFILENMGLYKLLNCFTGSSYKKRHIFKDYALTEYQSWFSAAWNEMIKVIEKQNGIWRLDSPQKSAKISISNHNVIFEYYQNNMTAKKSVLPILCDLNTFEKKTTAKTREEVFSKFINEMLKYNEEYNKSKRKCAIAAAENLAKELRDNLNYTAGLPRFLRIHEFEYYYAKTTSAGSVIYKVPPLSDFKNNIVIESIVPSVPNSQANILTTIRNKKTNKKLVLRNECRFSHGQFNGTPEAKMYYESGGYLLTIYEAI